MPHDNQAPSPDTWEIESYKQGSEACRNYSNLTMRVRTLTQQIFGASVVGLAAYLNTRKSPTLVFPDPVFIIGGITLVFLAVALGFVDWHYQTAFSAIRDSLAKAEARHNRKGPWPWRAHLSVRTNFKDHIASYLPFVLLGVVGFWGALFGWFGNTPHTWRWMTLAFALAVFVFVVLCSRAKKRDRQTQGEVLEIEEKARDPRP